jgi:acylphosphatase
MTPEAFTAAVSGHVQAVGFRFATRRLAEELGLAGWVLNRSDGSVAVWAQGPPDRLARLSAFLHHGPPGATVTSVRVRTVAPDPSLRGFAVRFGEPGSV